jgi:putative acetyltransferase
VTGWTIRGERPDDAAMIAAVTQNAFRAAQHTDGTEFLLPGRLRDAGDLTLSLVADHPEEGIVGHVAVSPVTISDGRTAWYGVGPVSVAPARQREGIGSALIRRAIETLKERGAGGCVVLGEPQYYGRFGFIHDPALSYPGPPPEYFQRLVLGGSAPSGEVRYSAAFG